MYDGMLVDEWGKSSWFLDEDERRHANEVPGQDSVEYERGQEENLIDHDSLKAIYPVIRESYMKLKKKMHKRGQNWDIGVLVDEEKFVQVSVNIVKSVLVQNPLLMRWDCANDIINTGIEYVFQKVSGWRWFKSGKLLTADEVVRVEELKHSRREDGDVPIKKPGYVTFKDWGNFLRKVAAIVLQRDMAGRLFQKNRSEHSVIYQESLDEEKDGRNKAMEQWNKEQAEEHFDREWQAEVDERNKELTAVIAAMMDQTENDKLADALDAYYKELEGSWA